VLSVGGAVNIIVSHDDLRIRVHFHTFSAESQPRFGSMGGTVRTITVVFLATLAQLFSPAFADCNPAPPGLSEQQWYQQCAPILQQGYRQGLNGEPYRVPYARFVEYMYRYYVMNTSGTVTPRVPPSPLPPVGEPYAASPCSVAGQTYCNASGWLLRCNGSVWLTGWEQCK
jgi:hypothetical protein